MAARRTELAALGGTLTEAGDLLLYGCNVASGSGEAFLAAVAEATGADVAASTDRTGGGAIGGNWVLEAVTGSLDSSAIAVESYTYLLDTINGTIGNDSLNGGAGDDVFLDPNGDSITTMKSGDIIRLTGGAAKSLTSSHLKYDSANKTLTVDWDKNTTPACGRPPTPSPAAPSTQRAATSR